jgi:signal transduction histidine kinase
VEIIDSGPGMTDAALKNIFTPFFTTKKRGTGLGMVVSLKIIENHKGKIKVTSKKNVGTVVQVFLPVRRK